MALILTFIPLSLPVLICTYHTLLSLSLPFGWAPSFFLFLLIPYPVGVLVFPLGGSA